MFSSNTSQVSEDANYIESCFSTHLYTGNGSTQTITNGIDLAGKGGLVWIKSRSAAYAHRLFDTNRGATKFLVSNDTLAEDTNASTLTAFTSSGFSVGASTAVGENGTTYASWTFREQPKFFDVVTYTGNGASRTIAHNLGSVPGCIIVKRTSSAEEWFVYHRSTGASAYLVLNDTSGSGSSFQPWNNTAPTDTVFSLSNRAEVNQSGATYVAYLFAHNAGGFGLTGTDNVISCGSFTSNSDGSASITLGYEPQFLLYKRTDSTGDWNILDTMRGFSQSAGALLRANLSNAEQVVSGDYWNPTATGFIGEPGTFGVSTQNIYIAIRRGPMKVPTTGTSVFSTLNRTGTGTTTSVTGIGLTPDLLFTKNRFNSGLGRWDWQDRLRGPDRNLFSDGTDAEYSNSSNPSLTAFGMDGVTFGNDQWDGYTNYNSSNTYINYFLRRASGFFDVVCYTGTGSNKTEAHNLTVVPEFIIIKSRSNTRNWICYHSALGNTKEIVLNSSGVAGTNASAWNNTSPTSSAFTVGTDLSTNGSGYTFVAYLFASCPGVSKVGSYTGTGTTQVINCGFTAGARFVLIKRTDSTGGWYVWDSARGIVTGNDPYLLLNSTAAEVTVNDFIDPDSTGFEISSTAPAAINASGGTFIFLAIA